MSESNPKTKTIFRGELELGRSKAMNIRSQRIDTDEVVFQIEALPPSEQLFGMLTTTGSLNSQQMMAAIMSGMGTALMNILQPFREAHAALEGRDDIPQGEKCEILVDLLDTLLVDSFKEVKEIGTAIEGEGSGVGSMDLTTPIEEIIQLESFKHSARAQAHVISRNMPHPAEITDLNDEEFDNLLELAKHAYLTQTCWNAEANKQAGQNLPSHLLPKIVSRLVKKAIDSRKVAK